jgi:hypothetical protein
VIAAHPDEEGHGTKRYAVIAMLASPATTLLSYREIGRRAGVSFQYVAAVAKAVNHRPEKRLVTRGGKTYLQRAKASENPRTASVYKAPIHDTWPANIEVSGAHTRPNSKSCSSDACKQRGHRQRNAA